MNKALAWRIVLTALMFVLQSGAAKAEDFRDIQYLNEKLPGRLDSQRVGTVELWSNPLTGNRGQIAIDREDMAGGMLCREYRKIFDQDGADPIIYSGRGCRDGTGRWRLQPEVAAVPPSVPGRGARSPPAAPRADPAPAAAPFPAPRPRRKPDPNIFYATMPTPSDY